MCWFLGSRGRREEAYTRVRSIFRDANFAPPQALRQLAQITDFDLFVTTTFDPLLEQAINDERFGGAQSTEVIAYSPNRVADLPTERERLQRPVVYHLLGRLSASPTYVISDEDTLEFICALQSEHLTPEKLFHELEHNHLLSHRQQLHELARATLPAHGQAPPPFRSARRGRSAGGQPLRQRRTPDELPAAGERAHARLQRRREFRRRTAPPLDDAPQVGRGDRARQAAPQRFLPPEREMPDNAVFISYAREDLAAVQKLKSGLDAAGVRTWFDLERLEGGDDYDRKIQRNIARCSYFIPIVSATTERRLEGYFRREWSYAIDRARNIAEGALFILPVVIDDTNGGDAQVPEQFKAVHFTRLPGGEITPEFARRMQDLFATAPSMRPASCSGLRSAS